MPALRRQIGGHTVNVIPWRIGAQNQPGNQWASKNRRSHHDV